MNSHSLEKDLEHNYEANDAFKKLTRPEITLAEGQQIFAAQSRNLQTFFSRQYPLFKSQFGTTNDAAVQVDLPSPSQTVRPQPTNMDSEEKQTVGIKRPRSSS